MSTFLETDSIPCIKYVKDEEWRDMKQILRILSHEVFRWDLGNQFSWKTGKHILFLTNSFLWRKLNNLNAIIISQRKIWGTKHRIIYLSLVQKISHLSQSNLDIQKIKDIAFFINEKLQFDRNFFGTKNLLNIKLNSKISLPPKFGESYSLSYLLILDEKFIILIATKISANTY